MNKAFFMEYAELILAFVVLLIGLVVKVAWIPGLTLAWFISLVVLSLLISAVLHYVIQKGVQFKNYKTAFFTTATVLTIGYVLSPLASYIMALW